MVMRLATGLNAGGGEIFHTRLDRPWGPPGLLHNGYRVSFPGMKRRGRGLNHPPPSSAEIKERIELYFYSPSGLSWPVLGRTFIPKDDGEGRNMQQRLYNNLFVIRACVCVFVCMYVCVLYDKTGVNHEKVLQNWLAFIKKAHSVLCEVRTESLQVPDSFSFQRAVSNGTHSTVSNGWMSMRQVFLIHAMKT